MALPEGSDPDIEDDIGGDSLYVDAEEEEEHADMWISDEEANWARELKRAVEAPDSGLKPLSDLEYAQYAMVSEGDVGDALERIKVMAVLRESYNVEDTVEQGVAALDRLSEILPGFLIHVDVSEDTGTSFLVIIVKNFDPAQVGSSERNWGTFMTALYYCMLSQQPTVRSIREGCYEMVDVQDMGWNNFDMNVEARWFREFTHYIPIRYKSILMYNTNTLFHIAYSMVKPFMRQSQKDMVKFGCSFDWESHPSNTQCTLSDMYLQPSYEVAMERLLDRVAHLLAMRFQNNASFALD